MVHRAQTSESLHGKEFVSTGFPWDGSGRAVAGLQVAKCFDPSDGDKLTAVPKTLGPDDLTNSHLRPKLGRLDKPRKGSIGPRSARSKVCVAQVGRDMFQAAAQRVEHPADSFRRAEHEDPVPHRQAEGLGDLLLEPQQVFQ